MSVYDNIKFTKDVECLLCSKYCAKNGKIYRNRIRTWETLMSRTLKNFGEDFPN